ncbi:MAG: hypothetical protein ACI83O_000133 [Patescibacteria group bacterium]|jgi:hypothetical protein
MQLERVVKQFGTGAMVVLPKSMIGVTVTVDVVSPDLTAIKEAVWHMVDGFMSKVEAIAVVGSYAKGEQTAESDIDVVVIASGISKRMKVGKYEITVVDRQAIFDMHVIERVTMYYMLKESVSLLNEGLILELRNSLAPDQKLIDSVLEFVEGKIKGFNEVLEVLKDEKQLPELSYSLMLYVRLLCLLLGDGQVYEESKGGEVYSEYVKVKNDKKYIDYASYEEIKKVYGLVKKLWQRAKRKKF